MNMYVIIALEIDYLNENNNNINFLESKREKSYNDLLKKKMKYYQMN
jgi:hypothetical protein